MAVSIKEVALLAGVSPSTVSRVLSHNPNIPIAEETRERVLKAAEELRYRPSSIARTLVRQQTTMIGVVLPPEQESPLRHPFFGAMFDGVLQAAAKRRINIAVFTGQTWSNGRQSIDNFRDGRCDGLLLFFQPNETSDIIPALLDAHIPVAMVNDVPAIADLSCVDIDNVEAARQMTRYLLQLGHRRIALLGHGLYLRFVGQRLHGFQQAFADLSLTCDARDILLDLAPWAPEEMLNRVQVLMERPTRERPTALFCLADEIASLVLPALVRQGIVVPDEVSVAGFNDDASAERLHPGLTTMRQPYERIAGFALDLIAQQITDPTRRGQKIVLPAELVVRASTAPFVPYLKP